MSNSYEKFTEAEELEAKQNIYRCSNIEWDVDTKAEERVVKKLPKVFEVELTDEEKEDHESGESILADKITDETGWCICGMKVKKVVS